MSNNPMTVQKAKSQSGSTLIEVTISLAMLGIMFVLFAASFNVVLMTKRIKNDNIAYHVASKQLESMRSIPYDSLSGSGSFTDPTLNSLPSATASYAVTNYPGHNGVKEMVVTVSWNDGRPRSVVLRSLSGPGGILP